MIDKVFLDTNIFIYSIDSSPALKTKRHVARKLLREHIQNETGVISIQVLQEFYRVSTGEIQVPITTEDALEFMHYMASLEIVIPDFHMVVAAVHLHQRFSLSFWDALILQAARTARCSYVFSEDLQDGFHFDTLTVRNPFVSPRT